MSDFYSFDFWWSEYLGLVKSRHSDAVDLWQIGGCVGPTPELIVLPRSRMELENLVRKVWDAAQDALNDSNDPLGEDR